MTDLIQELHQALASVRVHQQTAICHPDAYRQLQDELNAHPYGGFVRLKASALVSEGQLIVFKDSLLKGTV